MSSIGCSIRPLLYSGAEVLFGVYGYALQIYFDFSGYTDIAMGVSQLLGIVVPDNFNRPYWSQNRLRTSGAGGILRSRTGCEITSTFRLPQHAQGMEVAADYVNPLIVMLLGGLWHGIGWTFVAWGLLHGVALSVHRAFVTLRGKREATAWGRGLSIFVTLQFVCFAWVFFRAPDMATAWAVLGRIGSGTWTVDNISATMVAWFVAAILLQFIPVKVFGRGGRDVWGARRSWCRARPWRRSFWQSR